MKNNVFYKYYYYLIKFRIIELSDVLLKMKLHCVFIGKTIFLLYLTIILNIIIHK